MPATEILRSPQASTTFLVSACFLILTARSMREVSGLLVGVIVCENREEKAKSGSFYTAGTFSARLLRSSIHLLPHFWIIISFKRRRESSCLLQARPAFLLRIPTFFCHMKPTDFFPSALLRIPLSSPQISPHISPQLSSHFASALPRIPPRFLPTFPLSSPQNSAQISPHIPLTSPLRPGPFFPFFPPGVSAPLTPPGLARSAHARALAPRHRTRRGRGQAKGAWQTDGSGARGRVLAGRA